MSYCQIAEADNQPESVQTESSANMGPITTTSAQNGSGQAGLVNSATGAAGVLAGWAISSLSKQMSTAEVHTAMSTTAPRVSSTASSQLPSPTPPTSSTVAPSAPVPGFGASKSSMKLKPTKPAPPTAVESFADEWDDGGAANAWGTDDLIDVNADTDDWAAFESAPVPEIVVPPPQSYYVKPAANGTPANPAASFTKPASVKLAPVVSPKPPPKSTVPAPASDGWDEVEEPAPSAPTPPPASSTPIPSLANMNKEEKELEMARRREERKTRIAAMKEQKKGKT
jgi:SCY1-like protein 1